MEHLLTSLGLNIFCTCVRALVHVSTGTLMRKRDSRKQKENIKVMAKGESLFQMRHRTPLARPENQITPQNRSLIHKILGTRKQFK